MPSLNLIQIQCSFIFNIHSVIGEFTKNMWLFDIKTLQKNKE